MRLLSALLLCLLSASALAADPPALLVTKAGFYYVITDDAGTPVLVKVTNVVRIGDGPPNVPNPPDTPDAPPPVTDPTAALVKRLAAEVNDPAGAKALALVYKTIGEKVDDGSLKPEDAFPAIKAATDQVLAAINAGPKWTGFRAKLGDEITRKLQAGELQHPRDYVKFLSAVAAGLEGAAPAETALSPELVQTIVQLILAVLSRLLGGAEGSPV